MAWNCSPNSLLFGLCFGKIGAATLAGRAPELSPASSSCPSLVLLSSFGCLLSFSSPPLVLLLSSSCPFLVLVLSSSCPALVLLLFFSCPPPLVVLLSSSPFVLFLSSGCAGQPCVLVLSSSCPPRLLLLSSSSFGRAGEPCVFLLLLVATFSNPVGPPGNTPRCPRATVASPVSFFCCLSRSPCPACPRCGPSYPGLVPCLATRFFLSPPPCLYVFMRLLMQQ